MPILTSDSEDLSVPRAEDALEPRSEKALVALEPKLVTALVALLVVADSLVKLSVAWLVPMLTFCPESLST